MEEIMDEVMYVSKERQQLIVKYALCAGNLYGFITTSQLLKLIKHYEKETFIHQEVVAALRKQLEENSDFKGFDLVGNLMLGTLLSPYNKEDALRIEILLDETKGRDRYYPESKEEFFKFLDINYIPPNKCYDVVRSWLLSHHKSKDEKMVEADVIALHNELRFGDTSERPWIIKILEEENYNIGSEDEVEEISKLAGSCFSHTNLYDRKGYAARFISQRLADQFG
jgi:hypothetical protein